MLITNNGATSEEANGSGLRCGITIGIEFEDVNARP